MLLQIKNCYLTIKPAYCILIVPLVKACTIEILFFFTSVATVPAVVRGHRMADPGHPTARSLAAMGRGKPSAWAGVRAEEAALAARAACHAASRP